ncbi:MAG TPA: DsbA family protein [Acidimicrobiales bacterium]|jgi:predicted DsbA family dithiol-disulfide isomerase|nr:DsbA family protein [Acidimicrobiales bacterium]
MQALVWSDYICPWAYLGRDRTRLLRSLDVAVTPMPYELHPELPAGGRAIRPDGRMAKAYADIAALCTEVELPFATPRLVPNSRRALETAEVVRGRWPEAFDALDDALFSAHFVDGVDIGDPEVIDAIVAGVVASGASAVRTAVDSGAGAEAVSRSMALAHDHGVAATPAWLFEGELVVPGAQPRELFERIVSRLRARTR